MIDPSQVLVVVVLYMGVLFLVGLWAEHRGRAGANVTDNGLIYALSLAVYCTSWTYYGSVGTAANSGSLFLTFYLGPTLVFVLWGTIMRRMVAIRNAHHVTDLADFISLRHDKSRSVAALATLIALLGVTPYIGLQFQAVATTFRLLTGTADSHSWLGGNIGPIMAVLMLVFTIVLGIRRINPTERHQGVVLAVATESLIKLFVLLAVGAYVTFGLYNGLDDLTRRALARNMPILQSQALPPPSTWVTYLILAMAAVMFLPRQFHLTVVENFRPAHLRTAIWVLPLYFLAINVFVLPMALAGLLQGYPQAQADTFVLRLPMDAGEHGLALLVFLGGFSAATSMIMVATLTLSTMATNHLLMPVISWIRPLGFLRRHVLELRWLAAALGIGVGFLFERTVQQSYLLVRLGTISFTAILQFAPVALGGLFWSRGSKKGALWGLGGGALVWAYDMLLPVLLRGNGLGRDFLANGPVGLGWFTPGSWFGVAVFDPVTHTVFWSLVVNTSLYIVGSLAFPASESEQRLAREFKDPFGVTSRTESDLPREAHIDLEAKCSLLTDLLGEYFPENRAKRIVNDCRDELGLIKVERISVVQLARLGSAAENRLASSIGAAAAHDVLKRSQIVTVEESGLLSAYYARLLAALRLPPEELQRRVDYHQEREELLARQARELAEEVRVRELEITRRQSVEEALRESEERYRLTWMTTPDSITITRISDGRYIEVNEAFCRLSGYSREEALGRSGSELNLFVNLEDRTRFIEMLQRDKVVRGFELKYRSRDGRIIDALLSANPLRYAGVDCLVAVVADITPLKQAWARLRESEEKFRLLFQAAPDGIAITTYDGDLLTANEAFYQMFHFPAEEIGQPFNVRNLYVNAGRDRTAFLASLEEYGAVEQSEIELRDRFGRIISASVSARAVRFESHFGLIAIIRDISHVKRLEAQLRDYAGNLEAMVSAQTRELQEANRELSATVATLEDTRARLAQSAHRAGMAELAVSVLHNIGNAVTWVNVRARRMDETLPAREILTLEKIFGQWRSLDPDQMSEDRREKLLALGDATLELFQKRQDAFRADLEYIKNGMNHIMEIINLQQKYVGLVGAETLVDLNDLVRDAVEMVRDSVDRRGIRLELEQEDLPQIPLDKNKVIQILNNVIKNSYESLDGVLPGTPKIIVVATRAVRGPEDGYIELTVTDTGIGLDPEAAGEVFRFGYSTKSRGTGFGLHDSANYIKARGGSIGLTSPGPGRGARLTIRLPLPRGTT